MSVARLHNHQRIGRVSAGYNRRPWSATGRPPIKATARIWHRSGRQAWRDRLQGHARPIRRPGGAKAQMPFGGRFRARKWPPRLENSPSGGLDCRGISGLAWSDPRAPPVALPAGWVRWAGCDGGHGSSVADALQKAAICDFFIRKDLKYDTVAYIKHLSIRGMASAIPANPCFKLFSTVLGDNS